MAGVAFGGIAIGWPDGAAGAPVGGSFQQANFFTSYAPQNGQSYITRPGWRVAGVDYAVGYPSASTPLKDPTAGGLPSGSSYASNVITVTGANVTLDGWDLSVAGGIAVAAYAATGTLTVQNCKVVYGSGGGNTNNGAWLEIGNSSTNTGCNLALFNNDVNLSGDIGFGPTTHGIVNWGPGTNTFQYNRFVKFNQRNAFSFGTYLQRYNYFEAINFNSAQHGEWMIFDAGQSGQTVPSCDISFNTVLQPANWGGGATTFFYISSGIDNYLTWTLINANNNTCAINAYNPTGYIVATTLHITADTSNQIGVAAGNRSINTQNGVAAGTLITADGPGAPGVGTYTVNNSQTVGSVGSPVLLGFPVFSPAALTTFEHDNYVTSFLQNNYTDCIGVAFGNKFFSNSPGSQVNAPVVTNNIDLVSGGPALFA